MSIVAFLARRLTRIHALGCSALAVGSAYGPWLAALVAGFGMYLAVGSAYGTVNSDASSRNSEKMGCAAPSVEVCCAAPSRAEAGCAAPLSGRCRGRGRGAMGCAGATKLANRANLAHGGDGGDGGDGGERCFDL